MSVIHHTRTGSGAPELIFIHAFGCARSDWDAQVAQFSSSAGETSSYLELLKATVPGAAVSIVAGSGHYPQIEQAQATNAALKAFLQSIDEC